MDKVTVRVATPTKAAGQIFMPGPHEVDPETADELAAAGVLEADAADEAPTEAPAPDPQPMTSGQIDELVEARAKAIADGIVNEAVAALVAERDAAIARADAAEKWLAAPAEATKAGATAANIPTADAPKAGTSKKSAAAKG